MKKRLPFIALDLETTGLNPETDTIIEIAAIRGEIIRTENTFVIENISERTMLINPRKPLDEEVVLITRITNQMLEWCVKWIDVKEKIIDFIGTEAIILGHNVLFDIAMLKSHGIDLSNRDIIDTFELSEIFSQNAESLNLGFLGDFYGIQKRGQEHRALTDTWISVDLFCQYLQEISSLSQEKKDIWNSYALSEKSPISFLEKLFPRENCSLENLKIQHRIWKLTENFSEKTEKNIHKTEFFSLENNNFSEINYIQEKIQKHKKIRIITRNKKNSLNLKKSLESLNIDAKIIHNAYDFVAGQEIFSALENPQNIERKFYIFLLKLAFWLIDTKTWLLQELKFYGQEYDFSQTFRLQNDEKNCFWEKYESEISQATVQIETFSRETKNSSIPTFLREISLMEETIRKNTADSIDFEKLVSDIQKITNPHKKSLIEAVRTMESLYENIADRPSGEQPNPPGKYGETYFLTQEKCWSKGCKWLSMSNRFLFEIFDEWKKESQNNHHRTEKIIIKNIIQKISLLIEFQTQSHEEIGIIMTIINEKINLQFIRKNLPEKFLELLRHSDAYGFHLTADGISDFIQQEWNIDASEIEKFSTKTGKQIIKFKNPKSINLLGKTLILTTSMKHIREIGRQLDGKIEKIFLQGTSGGKSKMTHYFLEKNEKNSVLIGLLDSWTHEQKIFQNIDRIVIAKIPFDPPTDPHFLAKTAGMENNFEKYSKPIVLSRLNSLIGNAFQENNNLEIICSDMRINTTEWWKFMKKNLF